jgi:2-C-methyl-D-erythritol 2,4-cyclodiphosphate synthase
MFKVGIGQDSHRFSEDKNKSLILGGIEFSGEIGCEGNSDGDVIVHALCNALESAIGGFSFSTYADEICKKGVSDSVEYLKKALEHVSRKGYQINNIGISLEAKNPKIDPKADQIKKRLAKVLKISGESIGITATSGEELTAFGRGEGIQVFVIVSLIKK